MKKFLALTMCAILVLCVAVVVLAPQEAVAQTEYFATEFNGASDFVSKSFTVNYKDYSAYDYALALRIPSYVISGATCVPIAGANILGFYDRYYTELIPNFDPGIVYAGTHYMYKSADSNVTTATMQLAADMGLKNPATEGATINEFKTGITKYCNRKSLSVGFESSMQSGLFNYEKAKSQLDAGKPIIIFCSGFNLAIIGQQTNSDTIVLRTCVDTHAMAVFGYTEITYTLNDGSTRLDKYLYVASGVISQPTAYVYMGSDITIDDAYAVTIY